MVATQESTNFVVHLPPERSDYHTCGCQNCTAFLTEELRLQEFILDHQESYFLGRIFGRGLLWQGKAFVSDRVLEELEDVESFRLGIRHILPPEFYCVLEWRSLSVRGLEYTVKTWDYIRTAREDKK